MKETLSLIRRNIRNLSPYSTARDEYSGPLGIYLDANENPYGNLYNRYPDPHQRALRERLAQIKGTQPESIFLGGNGSDEAIDLAFRIFCEPQCDNALSIAPTYGMYRVAAAINAVEMREVPLREDFSLDVDALLSATDERSKLMFICSPNNPTGNSFPSEDIELLIRKFNGMVILDEAYIDFSDSASFLSRLPEFPNLIILHTLSKAWGMAGLRIGMAFAQPELVNVFARVKYPYTVNVITQQFVLDKLAVSVDSQISEIRSQRKYLEEQLSAIPLIKRIFPSDANFLLIRVDNPRAVYNELISKGIIVRDRSSMLACAGCLRITVGTPSENKRLIEILSTM
ncbi:MAG: histidinol-phosphate transaminase [Prevotellaceae bacterium]|jgi:histidinol-phosphate aminotransferase|nr:histidinol-phosphate transaminase [Prevotellaceae bacterium]